MSDASEDPRTVPQRLRRAAELFEKRNAQYGNNYKTMGHVMAAMYPEGLTVRTPAEFLRMMLQVHRITKETRYACNFHRGGHADSMEDSSVYAIMALETDEEMALGTSSLDKTESALAAIESAVGIIPPGYLPVTGAAKPSGQQVMFPTIQMADKFVKERRPEARKICIWPSLYGYYIGKVQVANIKWNQKKELWLFDWVSSPDDPPETAKSDEWEQFRKRGDPSDEPIAV